MKTFGFVATLAAVIASTCAHADISACVTVSATGPAASLGIPEKNTIDFLPKAVNGEAIRYIVYDDASDPTAATRNARKCVAEDRADIIIGSSTNPTAIAAAAVAQETGTPIIALAPVTVSAEVEPWTFRAVQQNGQMASAIVAHMRRTKVKSVAFIGYSDAYGEDWLKNLEAQLKEAGIALGPIERFARTDTSVTGQILKIVAARPDAVIVAASGTPAAMPATALAERGFKGPVYQTHGAATRDFIRVGGKAVEGTLLPVGPVVVASQLPADHPSRTAAVAYAKAYEEKYGAGSVSAFGGMMFDAGRLLAAAAAPALKEAKPGMPEFRAALRKALEGLREVVSVNGVYNTSPTNHYGHDQRSRVLVTVSDGAFKFVPQD